MKQSSILATCILLAIFQATFALSNKELGYNCDNVFFPMSQLTKVLIEAKATPQNLAYLGGEIYRGAPFRMGHQLWPVFTGTGHYLKGGKTPYRVVIGAGYQVFSVVMKISPSSVKECRYTEDLRSLNSYKCGNTVYPPDTLGRAALLACNRITEIASSQSPIRYDGPVYEGSGKQLYTTPVVTHLNPTNSKAEKTLVVFNTKCTVVGVVTLNSASKFHKCVKMK